MLGYYSVSVGVKGSEFEYFEKIWSTSNLEAEKELLNKVLSQGIDINDIEYCDSYTLCYSDYDSYIAEQESKDDRIYHELDEKG